MSLSRTLFWNLVVVGLGLGALELGARLSRGSHSLPPGAVHAWTITNVMDHAHEGLSPLPLAGLSRRATRLCQEEGAPVFYESDRYGFNNDDSVWDGPVDTVLIGDSFVQGYCVPREAQLTSALMKAREETGQAPTSARSILNLGLKGSGPFSQLGVLQEYALNPKALHAKPKRIHWFILMNDLAYDLERETEEPQLVAYSRRELQGLARRQAEVDAALASLQPPNRRDLQSWMPVFPDTALRLFTSWFRPEPFRAIESAPELRLISPAAIDAFASLLSEGAEIAREHEVNLDFIFIPDSWSRTKAHGPATRALVQTLKERLEAKGLRLLDPQVEEELQSSPNGESPFAIYAALEGYYGHFNTEGYRRFAAFVARKETQGPAQIPGPTLRR